MLSSLSTSHSSPALSAQQDDPNTIQSCAAASCCQDKVDEDGRNSCFDSARLSTTSTTSASKNVSEFFVTITNCAILGIHQSTWNPEINIQITQVTDPTPVIEQTTSSGHSLMSWNNLRATSSLTATAVACSILCWDKSTRDKNDHDVSALLINHVVQRDKCNIVYFNFLRR